MTKKIKVENKRQLNRLVKGYRKEGYFLITYGHTLAELERDNVLEDIPMDIDYNALEKKELKEKLLGLKDKCDISEPEYKALCLRLGIGYREHTYIEIAKIMNTSKQRVQQLTNNAIIKLRLCQEIKEYAAYLDAPDAAVENIDKMQRNLVKQHKKIARKMGYDIPKKRGKHE